MKRLRTCVIGADFMGAAHIEAIRRLGYVEACALCSRTHPEKTAEQLYVPHAYNDYREMLDKERPDAVHICTPNVSHYEMARYALEHGIHVLCEKPLAYTPKEAAELVLLAKKTGLVNAVNLHCRYYPMVREMKEAIGNG